MPDHSEIMAAVSFKEVEDSLERFDKRSRHVAEWFREFEELWMDCYPEATVLPSFVCRLSEIGHTSFDGHHTPGVGGDDKEKG